MIFFGHDKLAHRWHGTTEETGISIWMINVYITGAPMLGFQVQHYRVIRIILLLNMANGNLIWTHEVGASGGTTIGSGGITVDPTFDKMFILQVSTNQESQDKPYLGTKIIF